MKRLLFVLAVFLAITSVALGSEKIEKDTNKVKINVERMRVLLDMFFNPNAEKPFGYALIMMYGNVTTAIDTHNATLFIHLKDDKNVWQDSDVFYLGNTSANQPKKFSFVLLSNKLDIVQNGSIRFVFVCDEFRYDSGYHVI